METNVTKLVVLKSKHAIVWDFIIPIINTVLATALASWLWVQYQQPQVVCYADETYQKIRNIRVSTIYLVNEGRTAETNLSLVIKEKILAADIDVGYLTGKAEIKNEDQKTTIIIPKLKPRESAEVNFRSRAKNETFEIEDITSDSGNIRYETWVKSWWRFTPLQIQLLVLMVFGSFAIGYWCARFIYKGKEKYMEKTAALNPTVIRQSKSRRVIRKKIG